MNSLLNLLLNPQFELMPLLRENIANHLKNLKLYLNPFKGLPEIKMSTLLSITNKQLLQNLTDLSQQELELRSLRSTNLQDPSRKHKIVARKEKGSAEI